MNLFEFIGLTGGILGTATSIFTFLIWIRHAITPEILVEVELLAWPNAKNPSSATRGYFLLAENKSRVKAKDLRIEFVEGESRIPDEEMSAVFPMNNEVHPHQIMRARLKTPEGKNGEIVHIKWTYKGPLGNTHKRERKFVVRDDSGNPGQIRVKA